MGYTIIDILEKSIFIEEKIRENILEAVDIESKNIVMLNILSKVLTEECDKRIKLFTAIMEENKSESLEEIDFMTYDKISFLFNEYCYKVQYEKVSSSKSYLLYTKNLALEKYSLYIDIQGRLMNNTKDNNSITYKILSILIENADKQVTNLTKIIN